MIQLPWLKGAPTLSCRVCSTLAARLLWLPKSSGRLSYKRFSASGESSKRLGVESVAPHATDDAFGTAIGAEVENILIAHAFQLPFGDPASRTTQAPQQSTTHADFSQDDFQWAEVGERRLEQIETHECRKPEPVGVMVMGEGKADEDECAGKPANDAFHNVR